MAASKPIAPFTLVRAVVAAAAAAGAIYHLAGGEAALPLWLWKLGARLGFDGVTTVRLLASAEMTIALVVLLCGRLSRPVAVAATAGLAFASIAEISARWGAGAASIAYVGPFVALVIAGALLASRERWAPAPDREHRTPIGAGSVLAAVGLLLLSLGAAARLPAADQPRRDAARLAAKGAGGILFPAPEEWVGRTLPDTGVPAHLPSLTAETIEGNHIVVFYTTRCGTCHDFFRDHFGTGPNPSVIAVLVPPPADALLLESDQPEEIECPGCRRLALPEGPAYFVHTPLVMAVTDGRVTCVAWREPERCLPH